MRNHPIRFSDHLWDRISEEAQHMGISASEFVREAAAARMVLATERRLGPGRSLEDLVRAVERSALLGE